MNFVNRLISGANCQTICGRSHQKRPVSLSTGDTTTSAASFDVSGTTTVTGVWATSTFTHTLTTLAAVAGGIAAVSNFGIFGVEWGTPIPLPDQTLLLGLGVGKKVPAWDETKGEFVPTTEAQITLSFDHRSLDGGAAGRLLKRVIELLEDPKKL